MDWNIIAGILVIWTGDETRLLIKGKNSGIFMQKNGFFPICNELHDKPIVDSLEFRLNLSRGSFKLTLGTSLYSTDGQKGFWI